jgi:S-adenosylmethionine decarboxylase
MPVYVLGRCTTRKMERKLCGAEEVYEVPGVVGRHCIYELQGGDPHLLDNEAFIKEAITQAADASGATLLGMVSHKFEPQGVTAVALLSESHLSIHTWPEHGYAAIDAFTCGDHTNPEAACCSLRESLKATSGSMRLLSRKGHTVSRLQLQGAVP